VIVNQRSFGSWTRDEENWKETPYYRSRSKRRIGRRVLALFGVALILLSVGMVLADIRSVGGGDHAAAAAPKSERLWLTIPAMKRVRDIPVYTGSAGDESKLAAGVLHLQDTGFPWDKVANVYIAGHRLGYPRTKSWLVFWNLDKLSSGDKVVLEDSEGKKYTYRVFDKLVVDPGDAAAKKPIGGKNIVTLQTCTLPNYQQRLLVRAELISG
jgi:sortase A